MAEKKKKSPPKFGGKRALKDTSGDGKITFADTFLGDLLGFDGKAGTKGKAGLLKSLGGARRMKDGVETSKRPKARPASVTTAAKTKAASEAAKKKKTTLASETRRQQSQVRKFPSAPPAVLKDLEDTRKKLAADKKNKKILLSETRRQQTQVKVNPRTSTPSSIDDVKKGQANLRDRGEPKQLTLSQRNLRKFKKDPSSLNKIEKDRLFKSLKRQGVTIPKGLTGNNR